MDSFSELEEIAEVEEAVGSPPPSNRTPHGSSSSKKQTPQAPSRLEKKYAHLRLQDLIRQLDVGDRKLQVIPEKFHLMADQPEVRDFILSLVTGDLKREGLWEPEQEEICLTDAFPRSDFKMDPRFRKLSRNEIENGTFLEEEDLTEQDRNLGEGTLLKGTQAIYRLPVLSEPSINRLLRTSPSSLRHQVARRMIDTHYFEDFPEHQYLYACCYLFSKNVETPEHFEDLMYAGLQRIFGNYSFVRFEGEKLKLFRLLDFRIRDFFVRVPAVQKTLAATYESGDLRADAQNIWPRFYKVFEGLTAKQRNALKKVYMNPVTQTYKEVADDFQISVDSLQDRLSSSVRKFEDEFLEFRDISPKPLSKAKLQGDLSLNGLWRQSSAARVAPLYRIDPVTGEKTEIPPTKVKMRSDLTFGEITRIKATVIDSTPIPYFHETFYGDGVYPTILSFGYGAMDEGLSDQDQEDGRA